MPADLLLADVVAAEEPLQRVALPGLGVGLKGRVTTAERERILTHPLRELVDRLIEREGALDVPRCAERAERAEAREHLVRARAHVRDVVEPVRRTGRIRGPAALTRVRPRQVLDGVDLLALRCDLHRLIGRRAIPRREVLLVAGEEAPHGLPELPGEDRRDDRVLARPALGAEATAHVVAEHADVLVRDLERGLEPGAHAEHVLRRLPHRELVPVPPRDGAVRLEAVVQLRRGAVRGLDDDAGIGERALGIAALVGARLAHVAALGEARRAVGHGLLEIGHEWQHLVLDIDEPHRLGRRLFTVGGDRGDLVAREADLVAKDRLLAAERGLRRVEAVEDPADAGQCLRAARVDLPHARLRVRAPEHADVQHARQVEVLGVLRASGHPSDAVDSRVPLPHDGERVQGGPRTKIGPLDERGRLADPAFELRLRPDDADAHRTPRFFDAASAAATMFGYAPHRQRFPLTARRTSSAVGDAFSRSSATQDMIWPGVQKPHW